MELEEDFFEDAFEDERYTTNNIQMGQFEFEQSLVSLKAEINTFSVNREIVNSKLYHDKFEQLPVNRNVRESLYKETGRLLEFVDGQEQERMIAINARTGEFIVDNFDRDGNMYKTGFNNEESKLVLNCKDSIILIHNHSLNGRPSIQDILTYAKEDKISLSVIACYDGTLYVICGVNKEAFNVYESNLSTQKLSTSDLDEAKRLTMSKFYKINEKLGERHKLVNMICL